VTARADDQTAVTPPRPTAKDRRNVLLQRIGSEYRLAVVVGVLVLIWLFFESRNSVFLSSRNLSNLAIQTVVTGVLALGVAFVLLLGEIDLSIGAVGGVAAAVMGGWIVSSGWNPWLSMLLAVAAGALFGVAQGLLVIFGAPSFMVTLGSSIALGGLLLIALPSTGSIDLSQSSIASITVTYLTPATSWILLAVAVAAAAGMRYSERPRRMRKGGQATRADIMSIAAAPFAILVVGAVVIFYFDRTQGVPLALLIMLVLYALASFATVETRFGRSMYAIGNNKQAARRTGLRVERVTVTCFAITGAFSAFGGILAAARVLGVSNQSGGSDLVLEAIAAAVIGGISLFGGKGTVWAALLGALIIGSISNGMDLLGMTTETKLVVTGVILVVAVTLDAVATRGRLLPNRE
jgi:D-xylose transport system permease protein